MPRQKRSVEVEKRTTVKYFDTVFSRRLSELIKKHKQEVGKEELARQLGVTKRIIELWEARQSRPDIDRLCDIADYFGVTVDYLVGRIDTEARTLGDADIYDNLGIDQNSQDSIKMLGRFHPEEKNSFLNCLFKSGFDDVLFQWQELFYDYIAAIKHEPENSLGISDRIRVDEISFTRDEKGNLRPGFFDVGMDADSYLDYKLNLINDDFKRVMNKVIENCKDTEIDNTELDISLPDTGRNKCGRSKK